MRLIKGIHHAALRCAGEDEMNRTASFYCDSLGMRRVRSWGSGRYSTPSGIYKGGVRPSIS